MKTTTISHGISHVWCVNLSDRACETLCERDNIFHTLFHIVFTCLSHGKISHACGISCEISVKNMWIPCENYHFFTHYFTWFFTCLLLVVPVMQLTDLSEGWWRMENFFVDCGQMTLTEVFRELNYCLIYVNRSAGTFRTRIITLSLCSFWRRHQCITVWTDAWSIRITDIFTTWFSYSCQ